MHVACDLLILQSKRALCDGHTRQIRRPIPCDSPVESISPRHLSTILTQEISTHEIVMTSSRLHHLTLPRRKLQQASTETRIGSIVAHLESGWNMKTRELENNLY